MRTTIVGLVLIIAGHLMAATPERSSRQIIPAAAHTEGVGGSSWRTDLVVFNPGDRDVSTMKLTVLPGGVDPGFVPSLSIEDPIESHQTAAMVDVMGNSPEGVEEGAVIVEAFDAEGGPIPVVVDSRTWTGGPGPSFGQGIPAVAWKQNGDLDEPERRIVGLETSGDFRTNLGIVNPTGFDMIFMVKILDASGAEAARKYYRLRPMAHMQRNDILAELGLSGGGYTAVVRRTSWDAAGRSPDERPDFVAYGSKIDQRSNDPTYLAALPETTQPGLPKHRIVPAAAHVPGAEGSEWRTDVTIHSAGDGGMTALVVELIPTGGGGIGGGNPERLVSTIRGGETKVLADIIGSGFPDHDVAALAIEGLVGGGRLPDLRVGSRTWTTTGDGQATMGQGIPGIPRRSTADPVAIPGLESTDEFRSNLGLVNPSMNIRIELEVAVSSADGEAAGVVTYTLEPWSHLQVDSILDELDLAGAGYSAVVSLVGQENLMLRPSESWDPVFMAYGSRIDRATNDPTFIEGVRLTPEAPEGQGDWVDFDRDEPWYRCPAEPVPPEATVVRAFDQAEHWFGSENHRSITREVVFPEAAEWNQVGLRLELECPESGLCDHWDRTGSLQLVLNPDDPEDEWEYLEIMRHITPYRVGMCEFVDITPLAPLLASRQTLVSWIDTWVGPGHSDGEGWRITWDFVFYPGEDRTPDEVVNIWGRRSIEVGNLDPDHTVDAQTEPVEVVIPGDATRVEARLITTGHSFGNALNCAEFCVMRQDLVVDGERRSVVPWRTDCEHNPVNDQQGTWQYDRNGWCPGAITIGDTIDITDLVTPGETATVDFDIRLDDGTEYENTNPGGGLTPIEWVSLQVYIYRD